MSGKKLGKGRRFFADSKMTILYSQLMQITKGNLAKILAALFLGNLVF
jgi:hypothetical protein